MSDSDLLKCLSWLRGFLQHRGMERPDHRPLYAYQCSHDEYVEMLHLLKTLGVRDSYTKNNATCAVFVLFCAEWYRREYQRDYGWSWDAIWAILGYKLSAVDRGWIVPKGLEGYWQRSLHHYDSGSRNFLGTVFSEGGLPFQMLRVDGSRFQSLFDRTLRQYDQGHLLGYSTFQQVTGHLERIGLPKVFSEQASKELIAGMADQLVALVRDYGLAETDEPVARLDASNPKWRELFPIPLDEVTGKELLSSLLTVATVEGKKKRRHSSEWGCQHFWRGTHPENLWVQVSLPREVVFHIVAKPATTRFELAIVEGEKTLKALGPGYAVIDETTAKVRPRIRQVLAKRQSSNRPLRLVAIAGGAVIDSRPIDGSIVALGDVPLGFERNGDDDSWQLCGQASFNTQSQNLLVVTPEGGGLDVVAGDPEVTETQTVCGLLTKRVRGESQLRVVVDEEYYRIRTGHVSGGRVALELTGDSIGWPTKPALSYAGLPNVCWPNSAGESPKQAVELFVAGQQPGDGTPQELLGTQYVTACNPSGDTLLRRKVGILPADFRLELQGGDKPGQGSIFVFTKQPCLFDVENDSVRVEPRKKDDHVELRLSTDFPPSAVRLSVTPNLIADPIEIELPFPTKGCLGFDGYGNELDQELCVDNLLGSRLFLFGHSGKPAHFVLELTLKGSIAKNAYYRWNYLVVGKPLEVSLYGLREQIVDLLSLGSGIDQVVGLRVSVGGRDTYYRIRQYSTELTLDRSFPLLSASRLGVLDTHLPKPTLMLLHDPMRKAAPLTSRTSEGVSIGEFELPTWVKKDGPWLVIPPTKESVSFRPVFVPGDWQPATDAGEAHSLQRAVLNFDLNSHVDPFAPVLDAMATNPSHSGWQFLHALYEHYGYLPLTTFAVWKALVGNTRALAMALFKFEMEPEILGRLEAEFPIFWEFLPIADLRQAALIFAGFLNNSGVASEAIDRIMSRWLLQLGDIFPSYASNVQAYLAGKHMGPELSAPPEVFRAALHSWHQELLRGRSEDDWPTFSGNELKKWHLAQSDVVMPLHSQMDYRNTVLYLPVFAAAVASGDALVADVFEENVEEVFLLRQARDFDTEWFNSIYQYCLLNRVLRSNEVASNNE